MTPSAPSERDLLKEILRRESVFRGEFVLASGQKSNLYVDCRLTTLRGEAMPLIGRLCLERMQKRGWRPDVVGGMTMGADPVVCAIAREAIESGWPLNAFLVRKEAKKHGRAQYIEGLREPEGLRAVVVDDVCTTGGSTVQAIERARQAGIEVIGALCLVDREQGGREAIEAEECPFEPIFTLDELLKE